MSLTFFGSGCIPFSFFVFHPTYNSWHWSFPTPGTQMEDVTLLFTLGAIPLNKYPYLTISGLLAGGKPTNIGGIGNSVLGEPQELLTLAPFPQINPPFLIIWGLLTVGSPHLELLAFVISYAGDSTGTFDTVLSP